MDIELFRKGLSELCLRYGVKLGEIATKVYYEQLSMLSDEQFIQAVEWAIGNERFMPTPKQLFEAVNAGYSVDELWDELLKASHYLSGYRYDQKYRTYRDETIAKLPSESRKWLTHCHVSLLELGAKSERELSFLKRLLQEEMKKITPKNTTLRELNRKENKILNASK